LPPASARWPGQWKLRGVAKGAFSEARANIRVRCFLWGVPGVVKRIHGKRCECSRCGRLLPELRNEADSEIEL